MSKTIEQSFTDWEASAFGFGYGTGEEHTLGALHQFFSLLGRGEDLPNSYDYQILEKEMGPTVAWLMINALCSEDIIEYGTSPRFGWLTPEGVALKDFVLSRTLYDLVMAVCDRSEDYIVCYRDACNCGERGYEEGRVCQNPFWRGHH